MIVEWPPHWNASELQNAKLFAFDNGIWQGKKPPFVNCNVIRNTDFRDDGAINFAKIARIPIEQRQLPKKALLPGDIIIERSGGGPQQPVGRVVLFQANSGTYSFSNFTSRVRVVTSDVSLQSFCTNSSTSSTSRDRPRHCNGEPREFGISRLAII